MEQNASHSNKKLLLGVVSLGIGLLAANFALFNWTERTGLSYLLANYARYICAYGGFGAMIFGAMLVDSFLVKREALKRRLSENALKTLETDKEPVRKKKATQPTGKRKPRKKVPRKARKARQE